MCFWYSLVCIGAPFLLTLGGFWWLLGVRAVPKLPRAPAFVRGALLSLLQPLLTRVARRVSDLSGPEKRLAAQAFWGAFRRRAMDRSSAIGLRLSTLAQSFGLGFTAGIVLFSWLDCLFYSRVFGWQSTQFTITARQPIASSRRRPCPGPGSLGRGLVFPASSRWPPPALSATRIRACSRQRRGGVGQLPHCRCAGLWFPAPRAALPLIETRILPGAQEPGFQPGPFRPVMGAVAQAPGPDPRA